MTYFACFYQFSAVDASKVIEACGDRSIIILDGRVAQHENARIAARVARERGYVGYTLHRGEINGKSTKTELVLVYRYEVVAFDHGRLEVTAYSHTAQGAADRLFNAADEYYPGNEKPPLYVFDFLKGAKWPYTIFKREANAWVGTQVESLDAVRNAFA